MKRIVGLAALSGLFVVRTVVKRYLDLPDGQIDSTFASIRAADPKKPSVSKAVGTFSRPFADRSSSEMRTEWSRSTCTSTTCYSFVKATRR